MWSKRSVLDSVLQFALALPLLFWITRQGSSYGTPFIGGLAAGLASGHLVYCTAHELSRLRLPARWLIPLAITALAVFMGPVPMIFLRRWPHSGQGFVLGVSTMILLEGSLVSLLTVTLDPD
jgi:4-amino-4-deoxy-L-arabinose transferase-like glycosyltransferase